MPQSVWQKGTGCDSPAVPATVMDKFSVNRSLVNTGKTTESVDTRVRKPAPTKPIMANLLLAPGG